MLLVTAVGVFVGFSSIQQTLGFQLQDKLHLSGIETAQMTGAALMVSAAFTFLIQVTVMQRLQLRPTQFIRVGLLSMLFGAAVVSGFETFAVLAVGMAFLGTGMALCMPSISAGASLAVSPEEQGARGGTGEFLSRHRVRDRPHLRRRAVPDSQPTGAAVQRGGVIYRIGGSGYQ